MSQDPTKIPPLPTDPGAYFALAAELPKLPTPVNASSPLRKLGPSPFPKTGFPTLGFLEAVYEHIQDRAKARPG